MISLSSFFFVLYLIFFISVGIIASIFIIPSLVLSFIFASFVVIFGFLSDITFRISQKLYLKVDHRLRYALKKMSAQRKSEESKKCAILNNSNMVGSSDNQMSNTVSVPAEPSTAASGIARSLETRANLRVTS
ncbi:hypothetical protein HG535_0D01130 [Zygotorulaspora mrakii]|uniref:Outer spore wall protein 5 n=1 Tax=Zygotorulaspora mrakii TaxID=42260 RepID=A0A7H9B154_ZYGMR|nr:uncharacterized protein HG535_0D01130 [Zygotorulaspora mrakii]QLG72405.1 hypothetical protein HG535_0D01130 [Zygotorulaspora mrakii]